MRGDEGSNLAMKFGLFHTVQWPASRQQTDVYREAMDEIVLADELGFHAAWLTEHHFSRHGIISDTMAVLAYLAARTKQIRLGTAVTVLPFHNPVRLAETIATIDVLSGGRVDLGIGRGYQWSEFNGFNIDMDERATRFDEVLDVMMKSWASTEAFEFEGPHWKYGLVDPQPKPVQRPHPPIWVATESDDGLRRCAREGWGVMLPQGRPLHVVEKAVKAYHDALDHEGVPFNPEMLVLARALHISDSDDSAWAVAGPEYSAFIEGAIVAAAGPKGPTSRAHNPFATEKFADSVVFGSPETCIKQTERLRDLGVEYVIWFTRFGELAHADTIRTLERFASEVAPALDVAEALR
ncbi:MAG TPA: LLM class flavin-dependent oxidoreductase [Ilumatobacteraceae bacterium]